MSAHPGIEALEALAQSGALDPHVAECAECAREVALLRAERALFAGRAARAGALDTPSADAASTGGGAAQVASASRAQDGSAASASREADLDALWAGVEARISRVQRRRPRWHWPARIAALAAIAAAIAVAVRFSPLSQRASSLAAPGAQQPAALSAQDGTQQSGAQQSGAQTGAQGPQQTGAQGNGAQSGAAQQPGEALASARPRRRPDPKALAALDTAEADYRHAAEVLEAEYASLRPSLDPQLAARWDETLTRARTSLNATRASVASDDLRGRMRVLDGYAGYLHSLRDVIQSEEANP